MTREQAKAVIEKLVNRFAEQRDGYHASDYNETKTRRDFIDPLFTALGWDMDNEQDVAEPYREVIHEDKVKIQGKTKSPDYGFRLQGSKQQLFFVEAKKPTVALKTNKESAFQIRRYGWNSKVSVSILTNFEEFIIYDCSKKPSLTDSSAVARLKYFTYDQFLKEFDFIYDTFSREAVVKGRFDKYVQSDTAKKGTQTPDKEFVASLDKWRQYIAIDIAKNNLKLNEDDLNFAVQLIIDRLIFLRFCEDRGVETYGQLKTAASKGESYSNLCSVFKEADNKYNSGLFDFKKDQITQHLKVTNKIIKGIIEDLYYPKSEYDFKALPVEVLGNAYEQFLGKVIRINKAHHAVIEEKPEVRKAGGVYYTPQYIVDYIVENTLGKLIKGKTPKEIEQIKIIDPACGSGSFLLGAFQYLLNYHSVYYHENGFANKKTKDNPLTPNGTLSTAEKKKILLNNIYGVDIDANAVEVSKLSLLLKCMEGETDASIKQQMTMFKERVLPDLDNNVKDGNSLIDTDFYDNEFDLGFEKKIKPFSWKKGFSTVFKQGGFDIVIGNPPYGALLSDEESSYLKKKYKVANYQLDTYNLFTERAIQIADDKAKIGFIIPSAWSASVYDDTYRKFISEGVQLDGIVITPKQTFKDASVETCILLFSTGKPTKKFPVERWDTKTKESYNVEIDAIKRSRTFIFPLYSDPKSFSLVEKIRKCSTQLSDFAEVVWGIKPYQKGKGKPPQKGKESETKVFHSKKRVKKTHRPLVGGSEVSRYSFNWIEEYIDYGEWLAEPRKPEWFNGERILVREVTAKGVIQATFINGDYVFSNSVDGIKIINDRIESKYLLGIINSKLITFYHLNSSPNAFKGAFPKVLLQDLRDLRIPEATKSKQKEIIKHVDLLLNFNEELRENKLQTKIEQLKQRIEHSEEKINQLVYELYELTPEEIAIIENSVNE
jgi:type I restriction-modification system DNA methylase subunit